VRGKDVDRAAEILAATPREGARVVAKVLASAVANARNNDLLDPDDLYISACYADEGTTIKRWRPRARGRATRIRKRTCHITVIVSRLPQDRLERKRARQAAQTTAVRSRRVAASRRGSGAAEAEETTGAKDKAPVTEAAEAELEPVDDVNDVEVNVDDEPTEDADTGEEPSVEAESGPEAEAEAADAPEADAEEKD
jgi:large subunit ribosomal protein L22